jgi:WD40 repeat protein
LVSAVAITPDSKLVISGSWDNTLKVWNLEKRELMFPPLTGHNSPVMSVAVTPDGKRVISASTDNTLKIWNLEIAESPLPFPEHSNSVRVVAVTPDGKRVISGAGDKTLKVWNLQTRELLQVWNLDTEKSAYSSFTDYSSSVTAATVSPDGKQLISGSADKNLKVWNLQTAEKLVNLKSPYKCYFEGLASLLYWIIVLTWIAIFFAPIDRVTSFFMFITSVLLIVMIRILIDNIDRHLVSAIVVIPDGKKVISGSKDNTLKIWDLEKRKLLFILRGHSESVTTVAITSDGKRVISGSKDSTIKVWNLGNRKFSFTLNDESNSINTVGLILDKKRVISSLKDKILKPWNLIRSQLARHRKDRDWITAVAVTPNDKYVISASTNNTLKVWNLITRKQFRALTGHTKAVNSVVVTPDGKRVISASDDQTLKVWDLCSGEVIANFTGESALRCCAVAPDGVTIVAGDASGRLHFLRLEGVARRG